MMVAVLSVGAFCAFSFAQSPAAPAPAKKPQPVIKQIPAGAMGFVVINDIKAFTDSLDKFLKDIGLGEIVAQEMPEGSLKEIMNKLNTGEGFNPSGGFALVMLDPTAVGMDLLDVLPEPIGKGVDFTEWSPPFVAFVPGESFAKVFPKAEKPKEKRGEKYETVDLGFGPLVCAQMGDYVLLSPQEKAINAVINAPKKLADEMSKAEYEMISRSQVAANLNMRVGGPLLERIFKKLDEQAKANKDGGPIGEEAAMMAMLEMFRPYLAQFQSLSLGGRIDPTAIVVEVAADFTADGAIGKAMASFKGPARPALDKLPNLGYILAVGAVVVDQKLSVDMDVNAINMMVKMMALQGMAIPDDLKARLVKACTAIDEQITGMQLVFGQAPKGAGLFGMAMALDCKDAAKFQAAMADISAVLPDLIKAVAGNDPDVKDLKITYTSGAETVGSVKVDVLEISSPKMASKEREKEEMVKIIGEDRIRFFLAPVGGNTVIATFGGGKPFLEEALKAASAGGGTIGKEIPADAAKAMPPNGAMILAFSAANLVDFIVKAKAAGGETPDESKMPKLDKTPLIIGAGCQGSACQITIFAPTSVIKDMVTFFISWTQGPAPAAMPANPGPPVPAPN